MDSFERSIARGLATYVAAVGALTALMAVAVARFDTLRAFLVANVAALSVTVVALGWNYARLKYGSGIGRRVIGGFIVGISVGAVFLLGHAWLESGSIVPMFPAQLSKLVDTVVVLGVVAIAMLGGMTEFRRREAAQRFVEMQAELKVLQAQVEPHFLFNTLANLRHLVQTGSRDALPMLDHLVGYLRTTLPEIRTASSTVGREIDLARAYLEIMRIRMGGALDFTIEMPDELAQETFPPLMLITLVENAVKHGVAPRARGHIAIRVTHDERELGVAVEDDGPGMSRAPGRGVGLANLRERLRALYGDAARLELAQREGGGMRAAIGIRA